MERNYVPNHMLGDSDVWYSLALSSLNVNGQSFAYIKLQWLVDSGACAL